METNLGQAPAAEASQVIEEGRLARIGNMLRNSYESVRDRTYVYTAIGASVLALTGGVRLALNQETADAATDLDPTEQECADAGTTPSVVEQAYMKGARKKHGAGWSGFVGLRTEALPEVCAESDLYRLTNSRILMQDGLHHKRWIYIQRAPGDNDGLGLASNDGGTGGVPFYNINYEHDHSWTKYNYVCSPGRKKTKVRFQQVNTLVHVDGRVDEIGLIHGDYQVVAGPRVTNHPIKVYGAC